MGRNVDESRLAVRAACGPAVSPWRREGGTEILELTGQGTETRKDVGRASSTVVKRMAELGAVLTNGCTAKA